MLSELVAAFPSPQYPHTALSTTVAASMESSVRTLSAEIFTRLVLIGPSGFADGWRSKLASLLQSSA